VTYPVWIDFDLRGGGDLFGWNRYRPNGLDSNLPELGSIGVHDY
jgi:hypothetical protein